MKNIWFINHYAGDMFLAEGGRHYSFAKYLKRMGYSPTIFCANTKHNTKSEKCFDFDGYWVEKINELTNVPYVFVKARAYSDNGKQRIMNMLDFYKHVITSAKQYAQKHGSPEIIIASSVHPLTLLAGIKLAKHYNVKCICEVRDLWPESIVTYVDGYKKENIIIKALYAGEKYIYKKADSLIFTMEGGYDYICERGWGNIVPKDKVYHINNGVDLEQFCYNRDNYKIDDEDLKSSQFFNIVYTGSIRKVNNLNILLDIAKETKDLKVKFLIWGDGDELPALKDRVKEEKIHNVVFKGKVDKKFIPFITSNADLNFAHNDESPLFRFGISFNKLFDYFAAGKPIICDFESNYNPAITSGAGECYKGLQEVVAGIERFAALNPDELEKYCRSSKSAAEYYDFKNLTNKLLFVINKTVES